MRWDAVGKAVSAVAASDATLAGIYGQEIRLGGMAAPNVPSLQYRVPTETEVEQWAPCVIQWDQWTASYDDLIASERALRSLFHHPYEDVTIAGVFMQAVFEESVELVDGAVPATPDRPNYYGRAVRFRFTPIRGEYVT